MDKHKDRNETVKLAHAANALDAAKAKRNQEVNAQLNKLAAEQGEDGQMLITIVQAAVHQRGLPGPTTLDDVAEQCEALALRLTKARRTREWTEVKAVLDQMNARNPDPVMVAAAKRAGVELVETLAPRLVEG